MQQQPTPDFLNIPQTSQTFQYGVQSGGLFSIKADILQFIFIAFCLLQYRTNTTFLIILQIDCIMFTHAECVEIIVTFIHSAAIWHFTEPNQSRNVLFNYF